MTSLTTATQPTQQPAQAMTFSFYVAATGASIKLQAKDYLTALPLILATCGALDTSKIELLQGDADAVAIHSFVAEHGVGALDQVMDHLAGDVCPVSDKLMAETLDTLVGQFDDLAECGAACLEAIDSTLDSALADHTSLFDFEGYARNCRDDGEIFTVETADYILLFVTV